MFVALTIAQSRRASRPYRTIEASLPIASSSRMASFLVASFLVASPLFVAFAFTRPVVLPYAAATLAVLALYGEARELRGRWADPSAFGGGAAAGLAAAVDARIALVVMLALVPLAWRAAVHADRHADLPILNAEEPA
jgi:hypothetical protein